MKEIDQRKETEWKNKQTEGTKGNKIKDNR